ncbi:MAG: guanylate kinase [Bacteroidales bacterium]|nr:guanylate kinase [Bacteroidales bacterium]
MQGNLIIVSAPSGSGKSTLINHLIEQGYQLTFSISATSRAPRGNEQDGREYHFLSTEAFKQAINENKFLEYEEVYPGCFYGTLKQPIDEALAEGKIMILDVDVKGGVNVKKIYGAQALSIFIQPPSVESLRQRLIARNTDSMEMIEKRVKKAEEELAYASRFDVTIINDDLETAKRDICKAIDKFIGK